MARLGVGGFAGGGKGLLVQRGQLMVQVVQLVRKGAGFVGLLFEFLVLGLQSGQAVCQAFLLGQQCFAQFVGRQLGSGLAVVPCAPAGKKGVRLAQQGGAQLGRMGGGIPGGAAGVAGLAALGGQGLFMVLQRLFGHVVLRQSGRLRMMHRAAHRAGLAVDQILRQQARAVGVQLALHRHVRGLQLIQSGLRFGVGMLLFLGVGLGGAGLVHILQQGSAGSGQAVGQLDAVLDFQLLGVALAQLGAGGLGVSDRLFQRFAAALQPG